MASGNRLLAAVYDTVTAPFEWLGMRRQRARLARDARGRVLEIGSGTGAMLEHYDRAGVDEVVATDPDPHMLRRARPKADRAAVPVDLQVADGQALLFEDDTFDTVVVALSLCTVPDPDRALREARRVLRLEGSLLFVEHVRSLNPRTGRVQDLLTPAWRQVAGGCHLNRDTVEAIEQAGFHLDRVWRSGKQRGSLVQGRATAA